VSSAYSALFEGAIFSPGTISAAFHGGSVAAVFNPLSESVVQACPLIFAGLSVALAFRAGLFNIGAQGQFIGGALVAGYIGFAISLSVCAVFPKLGFTEYVGDPIVSPVVALFTALALGAVGLIAGYFPAREAAQLDPVVAMKL